MNNLTKKTKDNNRRSISKIIGLMLVLIMMLSAIGSVACATYWPTYASVTFLNATGGTFKKVAATSSTTKNSTMTWMAASATKPTYSGWTFKGWSDISNEVIRFPSLTYASGTAITSKRTTTTKPTEGIFPYKAYSFWSPNSSWSLTYSANGQDVTMPAKTTVAASSIVTDSPSDHTELVGLDYPEERVSPSGKLFDGYNTKADGTGTAIGTTEYFYNLRGNVTLYAQWKEPHKIFYNANGQNVTMPATQNYTANSLKAQAPDTYYTPAGKHFTGWNTEADGTGTAYRIDETILFYGESDLTLYAQWEDASIRCNYYTNDYPAERSADWYDSTYANEATAKSLSEISPYFPLTVDGHIFTEWNTKADGTGVAYQVGDIIKPANSYPDGYSAYSVDSKPVINLYAQWIKENHTVSYDMNGGEGQIEPQNKRYGEDIRISETIPTKEGYVFSGWNNKKDGTGKYSYSPGQMYSRDANIKLYAMWNPENGLDFKDCYKGCDKMTTSAVIPDGTFDMQSTYEDCAELTGDAVINGTPSVFDNCFKNTIKPILISGKIKESTCALLQGTANNNNVTCNHANLADTQTVLYDNGTFIINERPEDRELNIIRYGNVVKEYDPINEDENAYDFDIQSDVLWSKEASQIKNVKFGSAVQPKSMKLWFYNCSHLENINFTNLDTSSLTDASFCFSKAGTESDTPADISSFDVSNVTNMKGMFKYSSVSLEGIEGWNVSNVMNMASLFESYEPKGSMELDLHNWNVSNVTDMSRIFYSAGYEATTWSVDASGWDTRNITDMRYMFDKAGYSATSWSLDVSGWNVSNATDMSYMFSSVGHEATSWSLDISSWNTASVTDMSYMFESAGYNATSFSLELSNWSVSNVTNMTYMFAGAGCKATSFSLDLSNWNVSNVTNMTYMFREAGTDATTWSVGNLSGWNTANVTTMDSMFQRIYLTNTYVFAAEMDLGDLSNWDISKCTDFDSMFAGCTNLKGVTPSTFGSNLTMLGYGMFSNVKTFTAVTIPDSVTSVGGSCFEGCTNLAKVTIRGTEYTDKATAKQALTDNGITVGTGMFNSTAMTGDNEAVCIIDGTMVTLADGTNVPVEDLKETDEVLVWNQGTGEYDTASLYCIDHKDLPKEKREITTLTFDDGTEVSCVGEQGFFDADLCEFVYLTQSSQEYIGHKFVKRDTDAELEENKWTTVKLTNIETEIKECKIYSPVSVSHLCHYANDMLTMPGNLGGYFNLFEVDKDTLKINEEKYNADVQRYGIMSFEEFGGFINKETYDAINAKYLKVALGKGLLTWEKMVSRTESYSQYAQ